MDAINSVNATSLKHDISSILSLIYHNHQTVLVKRYGRIIAKIVPYFVEENDLELIAEAVVGKTAKNNGSNEKMKNASVWQSNLRKNEDEHRSSLSS